MPLSMKNLNPHNGMITPFRIAFTRCLLYFISCLHEGTLNEIHACTTRSSPPRGRVQTETIGWPPFTCCCRGIISHRNEILAPVQKAGPTRAGHLVVVSYKRMQSHERASERQTESTRSGTKVTPVSSKHPLRTYHVHPCPILSTGFYRKKQKFYSTDLFYLVNREIFGRSDKLSFLSDNCISLLRVTPCKFVDSADWFYSANGKFYLRPDK